MRRKKERIARELVRVVIGYVAISRLRD